MDPLADHRSRLALEQSDALLRRSQRLAEQTAVTNSPGMRLRVWEKLHSLGLPSDVVHPLLEVIARDTGLTLDQVREEQRQRLADKAQKKLTEEKKEVWDPYCVLSR